MKGSVWVSAAAVLVAGCLHPNTETCDDGRVCPDGRECYVSAAGANLCLAPDQLTTCGTLDDGMPCTIEMRDPGFCRDHICLPAACGDGFRRDDEQCDGEELGPDGDCANFGYYYSKAPTCSAGCSYDLATCVGRCGDGIVDSDFELCDGADPARSCSDMGYGVGYLTCSDDCGPGLENCRLFGWDPPSLAGNPQAMVDVHGFDDNRVVAVGKAGGMLQYDGANWYPVDLSTCVDPMTFDAASVWTFSDSAFIGGTNGTILRLTDAPTPTCAISRPATGTDPVTDLWATSETDIYAVTAGGVLHFDGTTWSTSSSTANLTRLWGSGPDDVYAAGATVIHRTAGDWTPVATGTITTVSAIFGRSSTDFYLGGLGAGGAPVVAHYNGSGWTLLPSVPTTTVEVAALGSGRVLMAGDAGGAHLYELDGDAWIDLGWPTTAAPATGLWTSSRGAVFITALDRRVYRFPGTIRFDSSPVQPPDLVPIAQMSARSANEAYFVTDDLGTTAVDGSIYGFSSGSWFDATNGGSANPPAAGAIRAVSVAADGTVYILETGAGIRRRKADDSWTDAVAVAGGQLWAAGLNDAWIINNGAVSGASATHYNGIAFSPPFALPANVESISGASPTDIWIAGHGAMLAHYDGMSWTTVPTPAPVVVWWAVATCGSHVFAGGTSGVVAHFDGTSWTTTQLPQPVNPNAMWCSGPNDVFLSSNSGYLFWFDGEHWSTVDSGTTAGIRGLSGAGDTVFVGDDEGHVHRIVRATTWQSTP